MARASGGQKKLKKGVAGAAKNYIVCSLYSVATFQKEKED